MATSSASSDAHSGKWMALIAALLGWMFDGFEIGLFPLIGPNALNDLLGEQAVADPTLSSRWFGAIMAVFLVGAATGGVVFGWIGDKVGRVRAMSLSIFTYAIFTGLCAFASAPWHIAVLRFIASLGMGGEWALGVALVTELWPDKSRTLLAGLIGAAANVGFLLVALLSLSLVSFTAGATKLLAASGLSDASVESLMHGEGWRLLMIAGALPALIILFIRFFVPESKKWQAAQAKEKTSHWATRDLLGVVVGALGAMLLVFVWSPALETFLTAFGISDASIDPSTPSTATWIFRLLGSAVGLVTALVGYLFPVVMYLGRAVEAGDVLPTERSRHLRRMLLAAVLAGVPLLGTWGSLQWAPKWATALAKHSTADQGPQQAPQHAKEYTQIASATGAIVGTMGAAVCGMILSRRMTYLLLCIGSFASLVFLYRFNSVYGMQMLVSVFVAGGVSAAFYGWFPLYFPELFPTKIRATCQGFAYNFGRVISAVGTLQAPVLTAYFARGLAAGDVDRLAFPKAGATLASIYLLGAVLIWLGPETKGQTLED